MSEIAIRVKSLGKKYSLTHKGRARGGLRHVLQSALSMPWRSLGGGWREAGVLNRANPVATNSSKDFWALQDVSFEIKRGEVMGIIGRNGAGKSTLLKILSRITEPTVGRIEIDGRVASLLEVGTGFHSELTGRENIYLNGAILGMTRGEVKRRFDEIVAFAEVEKFLDTPVKHYSSGMYVRLGFAVAAHLEPDILIVDEVLAVGDIQFQNKCLGKMAEVSGREGRTVLFVSHNMATVRRICSRGVFLRDGKIAHVGLAASAIQEYLSSTSDHLPSGTARAATEARPIVIAEAWMERHGRRSEIFVHGDDQVVVMVIVSVAKPLIFAIELVLRDAQLQPIAFAPAGLINESDYSLSAGSYSFRCLLPPLNLAQGRYALDIITAESGVALFDHIESALRFSVDSATVGRRNWNFHQDIGRGCLLWEVAFSQPVPFDGTDTG